MFLFASPACTFTKSQPKADRHPHLTFHHPLHAPVPYFDGTSLLRVLQRYNNTLVIEDRLETAVHYTYSCRLRREPALPSGGRDITLCSSSVNVGCEYRHAQRLRVTAGVTQSGATAGWSYLSPCLNFVRLTTVGVIGILSFRLHCYLYLVRKVANLFNRLFLIHDKCSCTHCPTMT